MKPVKLSILNEHILMVLTRQSRYGTEIQQLLNEQNPWGLVTYGTLYPTLGRLVEAGLIIEVPTEKKSKAAKRKYYQITEFGRFCLQVSEEYRASLIYEENLRSEQAKVNPELQKETNKQALITLNRQIMKLLKELPEYY